MGHKDNQAGLKAGPGRVSLAGCKVAQPDYMEKIGHEDKPLERVNIKDSHTHRIDTETCKQVYHPTHNAKNMGGWDLERIVRPRGSIIVGTIDTPQEKCSPA